MGIALFIGFIGLIWSLAVAVGKNRSPAWALLGFLMPIIGVVVAISLEPFTEEGKPQPS